MIAKKSKQADLERKRFAFFQIGLVVAGAATLLAFEYKSVTVEDKKVVVT
jgi:protein TonB